MGGHQAHLQVSERNQMCTTDFWIGKSDQSRRLHLLQLVQQCGQSEFDVMLSIYSPMAATPYNGGQNYRSERSYQPQRPSTQSCWRQRKKQSGCTGCRSIFRLQAKSTIYEQRSIATDSAIHLIRNLVYHAKTKHIEVRIHHIPELITEKKPKRLTLR